MRRPACSNVNVNNNADRLTYLSKSEDIKIILLKVKSQKLLGNLHQYLFQQYGKPWGPPSGSTLELIGSTLELPGSRLELLGSRLELLGGKVKIISIKFSKFYFFQNSRMLFRVIFRKNSFHS